MLHPYTKRAQPHLQETALALLAAALAAADPRQAIHRSIHRHNDTLIVGDRTYDLQQYRHIYVVGGGKAAIPMAIAVEEILGDRLTAGIVNTRRGHRQMPLNLAQDSNLSPQRISVVEAGHPIPDEDGQAGAERMAALLRQAEADDLVLCLISGGGSALMALPAPGITLADKQAVTAALLASGATINEINIVRKHLSQSKGGYFALLAYPAEVIALILSDVVGSPLDVIASGPTVPDPSTFADAWKVLEHYGLIEKVPPAVRRRLQEGCAGLHPDTPSAEHPAFKRVFNLVVADNRIAAQAIVTEARKRGFNTLLLSTSIEGEAREVAKVYAAIAREIAETNAPLPRPACLVAGGETTVTLRGQGKGGRNQEMALAAALKIAGLEGTVILCAATDGSDGPTDAAGAIVDGTTVTRARALGLDPMTYLTNNDSYHFFDRLGDLVITGPTHTNVNDLTVILVV